jgi:hypothetical protein
MARVMWRSRSGSAQHDGGGKRRFAFRPNPGRYIEQTPGAAVAAPGFLCFMNTFLRRRKPTRPTGKPFPSTRDARISSLTGAVSVAAGVITYTAVAASSAHGAFALVTAVTAVIALLAASLAVLSLVRSAGSSAPTSIIYVLLLAALVLLVVASAIQGFAT